MTVTMKEKEEEDLSGFRKCKICKKKIDPDTMFAILEDTMVAVHITCMYKKVMEK